VIGKGDWEVLTSAQAPESANPAPFRQMDQGRRPKVETGPLDKEVLAIAVCILLSPCRAYARASQSDGQAAANGKRVRASESLMHFSENSINATVVLHVNTDRPQTLEYARARQEIVASSKGDRRFQH